MSDEQSKAGQRLCWRFWLVLFMPTIITLLGTALIPRFLPKSGLSGLVFVNLCLAPAVNIICSIKAARMVVLMRDPRGGTSPWMFLWAPLFFFLNAAIVFGGCVLARNMAQ